MPISMTAISCSGSRRSNCSGRPKALFRLPRDLSTLNFAPSAAAIASLVVVLPAEPVMATTRLPQCLRTCAASACNAISGSSVMSSGAASAASGSCATRARETTAATAPRSSAPLQKVVPIQPLAAHRKKQLARAHGARVDRVAAHLSAPALATLAGASSTAPAPIAASASVSFIVNSP